MGSRWRNEGWGNWSPIPRCSSGQSWAVIPQYRWVREFRCVWSTAGTWKVLRHSVGNRNVKSLRLWHVTFLSSRQVCGFTLPQPRGAACSEQCGSALHSQSGTGTGPTAEPGWINTPDTGNLQHKQCLLTELWGASHPRQHWIPSSPHRELSPALCSCCT